MNKTNDFRQEDFDEDVMRLGLEQKPFKLLPPEPIGEVVTPKRKVPPVPARPKSGVALFYADIFLKVVVAFVFIVGITAIVTFLDRH